MEMYRIRPVAPNKTRIWKSQRIRSENAINFTMVEEHFENQQNLNMRFRFSSTYLLRGCLKFDLIKHFFWRGEKLPATLETFLGTRLLGYRH